MDLTVTQDERAALEAAQQRSAQVRHGRRCAAVLLRADGVPVAGVAQTVGGTETSVDTWTAAWRGWPRAWRGWPRASILVPSAAVPLRRTPPWTPGWRRAIPRRMGLPRRAGRCRCCGPS